MAPLPTSGILPTVAPPIRPLVVQLSEFSDHADTLLVKEIEINTLGHLIFY